MDELWRIELLGELRAVQGERIIARFRTRKTAVLLAYLALYRHRCHPREELIERFWPERDPALGQRSLRTALSSLRHQLEPPGIPPGAVITADRAFVRLNSPACVTDVEEFEEALQAADHAGSAAAAIRSLTAAAGLYRGELLPGFLDEWILPERQRLADSFLHALAELIAHVEQEEDLPRALQWAHRAVAADPLREEGHLTLMRLLAASGRPEAALRQYEELERLLTQELGAAPSPESRAFSRELRAAGTDIPGPTAARRLPAALSVPESNGSGPARVTRSPSPRASTGVPASPDADENQPPFTATGHLPRSFTRFFGREEEMTRVAALLRSAETSLVTLTGPGGTGKTRLALQCAERLRASGLQWVWFVPLLDLADPRLIPDKVLEVLRLPRLPGTSPLEQIAAFLSRQPSLLVLDNVEHLVEGGAEIVQMFLERVESLTVIATSRRILGLEGEREFPVAPLPVPAEGVGWRVKGEGSDRHEFAEPSTLHPPPYSLMQYPSVALFVDRAQAVQPDFQLTRTNAAAVAALCSRLEGLPLAIELAAARIGVLTPQQMLARLAQRFELLTRRRRAADPRHSSLQSTLDWSYQLLPPELQQFFARLSVFHGGFSLDAAEVVCGEVGVRKDRSPGPTPDTQYLTPTLAFLEQLRECSLLFAEEALPRTERPMPVTDGSPLPGGCRAEMRYRLLESVREYAHNRLSEAGELERLRGRHLQFFRELAERAEPELVGPDQAVWLERLEVELDNVRAALAWAVESGSAEEGLRLAGALWAFWSVRCHWAEGREWLARLLRQPGPDVHPVVRARGQACAGVLAWVQSDRREARALLNESLAVGRESGHRWLTAFSLRNLGMAALGEGDLEAAQSLLEEGLVIWRELGHPWGIRISLQNLAGVARSRGDTAEARALCEASLAVSRELGGQWITGWSLICLGEIATAEADLPRARAHFQEGLEIHRSLGHRAGVAHLLNRLGRVSVLQGDTAAAYSYWRESLALSEEMGDTKGFVETLEVVANSAAGQCRFERAARLLGAADRLRETMEHPLPSGERADFARSQEKVRDSLGAAAFAAAWEKGRALSLEQAAAEALEEE